MRILFVHQNFPGQYKHLASSLANDRRNNVLALTSPTRKSPFPFDFPVHTYEIPQEQLRAHPIAFDFDKKICIGEAAAKAALQIRSQGFHPDVICGHPGWGEMLFLREVWPDCRIISYMEYFYDPKGFDLDFEDDRSQERDPQKSWTRKVQNASILFSIADSDHMVSPTHWQRQQLPRFARERTSVIHDGIDASLIRPNDQATLTLGRNAIECRPGDEVITFVNRVLEPCRGFHMFMRALPKVLACRPKARAIIVGGEGVGYGQAPPSGTSWKAVYLNEVASKLDLSRVHFVGQIPYSAYISLLQVSSAHVYLTYPFVLSWSMLEAMAAGCIVIGSSTAPVMEVIEHDRNGLLVDFASHEKISDLIIEVLLSQKSNSRLRVAARQTILDQYDLPVCVSLQQQLISRIVSGVPA